VQRESEAYGSMTVDSERGWDSLNALATMDDAYGPHPTRYAMRAYDDSCRASSIVYGWHPYWQGTSYNNYDFSLLTDVCYFGYSVDPATGSYSDIHSWLTTGLVDKAKSNGRRVHLCATLFSNHEQFFARERSRETFIDSLISLVRARGADGVNIDFEGVPSSERGSFAAFMVQLARRFHDLLPNSQVSIAIPAVDWSNAFDVATMAQEVDLFIIMGYDYHWSGSPTAGPVSPKNSGTRWSPYDVTRSINSYLSRGVPASRLCLGLPYYGYEWETADTTIGAATRGKGTAVVYSTAAAKTALHGRRWEPQSSTPYYAYRSDTTWRECWYDDAISLGAKYDLVRMKGLAGIGIWALGYDGDGEGLWTALADHLSTCARTPCQGSFTDMGGPAGNYYSRDAFTMTIAPVGARQVRLSFTSFSIADDSLWIYDGSTTNDRVLGVWSGQDSPGIVTAASGAMTIRFQSNDSTVSWGWTSEWICNVGSTDVREFKRGEHLDLSERRPTVPRRDSDQHISP